MCNIKFHLEPFQVTDLIIKNHNNIRCGTIGSMTYNLYRHICN
jgi:hypothetical protein